MTNVLAYYGSVLKDDGEKVYNIDTWVENFLEVKKNFFFQLKTAFCFNSIEERILKNVNNCWNTKNTFYLVTSGVKFLNSNSTAALFINTT